MNDVYEMVFLREKYETDEDMWKDIQDWLRIATKNDFIVIFDEEETGIYVAKYGHADRSYGCAYPMFVTPEESDCVWDMRAENEKDT